MGWDGKRYAAVEQEVNRVVIHIPTFYISLPNGSLLYLSLPVSYFNRQTGRQERDYHQPWVSNKKWDEGARKWKKLSKNLDNIVWIYIFWRSNKMEHYISFSQVHIISFTYVRWGGGGGYTKMDQEIGFKNNHIKYIWRTSSCSSDSRIEFILRSRSNDFALNFPKLNSAMGEFAGLQILGTQTMILEVFQIQIYCWFSIRFFPFRYCVHLNGYWRLEYYYSKLANSNDDQSAHGLDRDLI